jgi:hypothetical protein
MERPTFMKRLKQAALIVLVLISGLWLWDFFRKEPIAEEVTATPLKEDEAARVVIKNRQVSVLTDKGAKATYVPSSGHAAVTVKTDGEVEIRVKRTGFGFQLGGGIVYDDTLRGALDLQFAYSGRLGLHTGLAVAPSYGPAVVPYLALGYKLDRLRLDNTSLLVGVTARKSWLVGIAVEL